MKIQKLIGGAASLSVVLLGSLSLVAWSQDATDEKSQTPHVEKEQIDRLNFRVGNKFFHARSEENGLYRDVLIHQQGKDTKTSKPILAVVFAKYARKETIKPNHWVLGSGIITIRTYDGREVKTEMKFKQLTLSNAD